MTEKRRFILINDAVRANAIAAISQADLGSAVTVGPATRSVDQNAKMWAIISDVSRAMPDGRRHTPDVWKTLFMHACGHAVQFEIGLNGQPFPTGFRSSNLTKSQMADLITFMLQWGDEKGVVWTETISGGFHEAANDWRAA